jgi:hypothetical protein
MTLPPARQGPPSASSACPPALAAAALSSSSILRRRVLARLGPGYPLLFLLPQISTQRIFSPDADAAAGVDSREGNRRVVHETTARVMAILSQLAIVAGMVFIGWRHFDNTRLGIAAAVLYLLMPYTAWMNGSVDHVLPGALVIWAVAAYRKWEERNRISEQRSKDLRTRPDVN